MARNVTLSLDETPWERIWQVRQIDRVECYCKIEVCSLSNQSMPLEQCSVGFTDSMSPEYRLVKGQPIKHSPSFRGSHVLPICFCLFFLNSGFTVHVGKFDLCTHIYTHEYMQSHFNTIQLYLYSDMCPSIYEGGNLNLFLSFFSGTAGSWEERKRGRRRGPWLLMARLFEASLSGLAAASCVSKPCLAFYPLCWPRCVKCTELLCGKQRRHIAFCLQSPMGGKGGGLKGGYEGDKKPTYRGPGRFKARSHKGLWSVTSCRVVPDVIAGFPKIENHTQRHAPPHNILKEPLLKGANAIESESLLHFD